MILTAALLIAAAAAACYDPSPAFPVPLWANGAKDLGPAFKSMEKRLAKLITSEDYDTASFSVEVTSNTESLWSQFHTARKRNETRPGAKVVDGDSLYRIASISKIFTTLGILYQHQAGNLNLESPVTDYIPELEGQIPWNEITIRTMASQLSGLPREFAQSDFINEPFDPTEIGLPPASRDGLPTCDEYNGYKPCKAKDLVDNMKKRVPLFAPNQQSTYSNANFDLLGLVLENLTGKSYEEYMHETIFDPLDMKLSTNKKPDDTHAVIPLGENYWDVDGGIQNPTGGIYSSTNDMSKFVRYIMTHFNAIATGVNWMMPASFTFGLKSFYGMPWEIFRTDEILEHSKRAVTFVTKSGGLPGYVSRIYIIPEYGLGITILVAGNGKLLEEIQEVVTVELIRAAERLIWKDVHKRYSGFYSAVDPSLNSSISFSTSACKGLVMTSFISNGTDIYNDIIPGRFIDPSRGPWRTQLVPTYLFKDGAKQEGEIWRITGVSERDEDKPVQLWDEFCTTDVDVGLYAGLPINEIVFWHEERIVEMPAWKVKMKLAESGKDDSRMVVQDTVYSGLRRMLPQYWL